jgi:O-acetylhomoserine (thiol)-lyase
MLASPKVQFRNLAVMPATAVRPENLTFEVQYVSHHQEHSIRIRFRRTQIRQPEAGIGLSGTRLETDGKMKRETIAIHSGYDIDPTTKAVAVPIYQTVSYAFDSAEHGAALFNLEAEGYRYTRIGNPTTAVLERRVAALEGGLEALCVASGQAAVNYAVQNVTALGSNIISVPQLYGTTHTLFAHLLPAQGVMVRFAESDHPEAIERLIDEKSCAVFCESVGNPAGNVCDIEALAQIAHKHGVPLIVDNTVATPILLRPIEYGADVVVHSLTKFLGGHGTTLGGAVVDSGNFPWGEHAERFPMFTQPDASYHDLVYTEHFGRAAYIGRCRSVYQRTTGAVLAPLSAFLLLQGIETVALRIERHVENGRKVAEFLRKDPRVEWINYAGFSDSPYYALAQKYMEGRGCSLIAFGVKGGFAAAVKFYDALRLVIRLVNLGDAKSLACHPASTTHRQMSGEEQRKAGVKPEMIRLSIGIEHIDDIVADLDRALNATI